MWRGLDEWRAEAAHVRVEGDRLTATGTQLGVTPETYSWTVDDRPLPELDGALDADLHNSPVFNSMPVLRHGMLGGGSVNYRSGEFTADIHFDEGGLVRLYEDYLERV